MPKRYAEVPLYLKVQVTWGKMQMEGAIETSAFSMQEN